MKIILLFIFSILAFQSHSQSGKSPNVFIITTDGLRWEEVFNGADSLIINSPKYVKDTALLKHLFWKSQVEERRSTLMPFVWGIIAKEGSIYGNRNFKNYVSIANPYKISYAGYNEIFTGFADPNLMTNKKINNPNDNVLSFLNNRYEYKNSVAAFTSWNLFHYIFKNNAVNKFYLNSGYQPIEHDSLTDLEILSNGVQAYSNEKENATRNDMLTFVTAKEYIVSKHPKIVYIGFGETDENAHKGNYDDYLQSIHLFDEYLAQLWYLINSDPFYKDNTSIIITTDHGRGRKQNTWTNHNMMVAGSGNTWLITLGPKFEIVGEAKNKGQILEEQLAATIAVLASQNYISLHPVAEFNSALLTKQTIVIK